MLLVNFQSSENIDSEIFCQFFSWILGKTEFSEVLPLPALAGFQYNLSLCLSIMVFVAVLCTYMSLDK